MAWELTEDLWGGGGKFWYNPETNQYHFGSDPRTAEEILGGRKPSELNGDDGLAYVNKMAGGKVGEVDLDQWFRAFHGDLGGYKNIQSGNFGLVPGTTGMVAKMIGQDPVTGEWKVLQASGMRDIPDSDDKLFESTVLAGLAAIAGGMAAPLLGGAGAGAAGAEGGAAAGAAEGSAAAGAYGGFDAAAVAGADYGFGTAAGAGAAGSGELYAAGGNTMTDVPLVGDQPLVDAPYGGFDDAAMANYGATEAPYGGFDGSSVADANYAADGSLADPYGGFDNQSMAQTQYGLTETSPGVWEYVKAVDPRLLGALGGALLGGVGGSKPAGETTTVEDIPARLQPYEMIGMEGLLDAYRAAPDMSPVTVAGNKYMMDVLRGDYLNNNPYLDAMYDKAAGKVSAGVNALFSKSGRYGSGAHQGVLGENLGNLATDIYAGNYAKERANQQAAALQSDDFGTASILQPFVKSKALLEGARGNKGGTTTQPYFRNRIGEILGGAAAGASIFR